MQTTLKNRSAKLVAARLSLCQAEDPFDFRPGRIARGALRRRAKRCMHRSTARATP